MGKAEGIIREWKQQLDNDELLKTALEAALRDSERADVEITVVLRTSGERVVMAPKIIIRR